MTEQASPADPVAELIEWHLPETPARPSSRPEPTDDESDKAEPTTEAGQALP